MGNKNVSPLRLFLYHLMNLRWREAVDNFSFLFRLFLFLFFFFLTSKKKEINIASNIHLQPDKGNTVDN